jgi:hypothetical protein
MNDNKGSNKSICQLEVPEWHTGDQAAVYRRTDSNLERTNCGIVPFLWMDYLMNEGKGNLRRKNGGAV